MKIMFLRDKHTDTITAVTVADELTIEEAERLIPSQRPDWLDRKIIAISERQYPFHLSAEALKACAESFEMGESLYSSHLCYASN